MSNYNLTLQSNNTDLQAILNTINELPEAGSSSSGSNNPNISTNEVNFYDYDGTLLHSYTVEEIQSMNELPELPTREGLLCQGWNYDLNTIKSHNRELNIGAMYITSDGKTRIYIHLEEGRTSPMLGVCPNGTVAVDWGDGTAPDTLTGNDVYTVKYTPNHEYSEPGDYVIKLTVNGTMGFMGDNGSYILRYNNSSTDKRYRVYLNAVQKIEIGNGVISIGDYAFSGCYSLSSITIPDGVTSIGKEAFDNCYSLSSINIPNSVTSIGSYTFLDCHSLSSINIPNGVTRIGNGTFSICNSLSSVVIPDSVTSIGSNAFSNCNSLSSVVIPNSVTSIDKGAFSYCYSLSSINIPDSVTSIGDNTFSNCNSLSSITIPDSVTSIGSNAFQKCNSLSSITIPDSVTSIDNYTFSECNSLSSITIPDGVTSIGDRAFSNCYSLSSITIPDDVTSIGSYTFFDCRSIRYYDFTTHTTIPTLSNTNAFNGISDDCEIRVPASLYDEWITATNWSTYANYIKAI